MTEKRYPGENSASAVIELHNNDLLVLKVGPADKESKRLVVAIREDVTHPDRVDTDSDRSRTRFIKNLAAILGIKEEKLRPKVEPKLIELAEQADRPDNDLWAQAIAGALVRVEHITRLTSIEGDAGGDEEPLGISAGPMMQMLATYLNERSGGALLGDLDAKQIHQVSAVMSQIVLRLGFDLAARQLPGDLRNSATEMMQQADRMDVLESSLTDLISAEVAAAAPALQEGKFRKTFRIASAVAPRAISKNRFIIIESTAITFQSFRQNELFLAGGYGAR